jgi:hypothetical protein
MAEGMFLVNGKEYPVVSDLTMGEMCDAEQLFGVEFGNPDRSGVRMMAALLWVSIHRVDDSVTVEDIRALPPETFKDFKDASEVKENPPLELVEDEKNVSSGGSSTNGGVDPEDVPQVIGAGS